MNQECGGSQGAGEVVMSEPVASGRGPAGGEARPAAGDRLARDMADLARQEVSRLRAELFGSVRHAGLGAALVVAAGVAAVLGTAASSTAMLRLLESALPRRQAACALAGGYLAVAGVLAAAGMLRLKSAAGWSSRLTGDVRRTAAAARDGARSA
jgi:hypothetical protein